MSQKGERSLLQVFRYSIWSWFGIVGGALTLLSNVQTIFELAKWADWLVQKWGSLITPLIYVFTKPFDVRLSAGASSMIAMAVFVSFVALGARLENNLKNGGGENHPASWGNVLNRRVLIATALYLIQVLLVTAAINFRAFGNIVLLYPRTFVAACYILYCVAIVIGLRGWSLWTSLTVALCMLGFSAIFAYSAHGDFQPNVSDTASSIIAGIGAIMCGFVVVGIAPPIAFTRRVLFIIVGVAFLVSLSWLSHWEFGVPQ